MPLLSLLFALLMAVPTLASWPALTAGDAVGSDACGDLDDTAAASDPTATSNGANCAAEDDSDDDTDGDGESPLPRSKTATPPASRSFGAAANAMSEGILTGVLRPPTGA